MPSKDQLIDYIHAKQREINILANNHLAYIENTRMHYKEIQKHIDGFLKSDKEYFNRFIMMPGLRGVGKTTILYQIYHYLINEKGIKNSNILYLDLDDLKSAYDVGVKEIFEVYLENFHRTTPVNITEKIFLLVDEAQLDENWAKYGKLLFEKSFNIFMIITGSSALDLELNTDARGE